MFYEERWIDGVLHSRHSPDAEFEPMSQYALSQRINELESEIFELRHHMAKANVQLAEVA
jgi:ribosomal protein L29